jgi:hypothetical protein
LIDHNDSAIIDVNRFEGEEWTKRRKGTYDDKGRGSIADEIVGRKIFTSRKIRGGSGDGNGGRTD